MAPARISPLEFCVPVTETVLPFFTSPQCPPLYVVAPLASTPRPLTTNSMLGHLPPSDDTGPLTDPVAGGGGGGGGVGDGDGDGVGDGVGDADGVGDGVGV